MSRGLTEEPTPNQQDGEQDSEAAEIIYEMQSVVQQLIIKHNELADKVDKLEDKLTDARIQYEAQKLIWNKGL